MYYNKEFVHQVGKRKTIITLRYIYSSFEKTKDSLKLKKKVLLYGRKQNVR